MSDRISRVTRRRHTDTRLVGQLEQLDDDELDEWAERSAIVSVEMNQTLESVEVEVLRELLRRPGVKYSGPTSAT